MQGPTDADLSRIVTTLNAHGVSFIVVGGVAGQAHGASRPTRDVDVVAKTDDENLDRLGAALRELGAQIRGAPTMPASVIAAQTTSGALSRRQFGNWTTDAGEIDTALFIGTSDERLDFEHLAQRARDTEWRGLTIMVAALDDIIRAKELADRDKDHDTLPELRRLRSEQGDSG